MMYIRAGMRKNFFFSQLMAIVYPKKFFHGRRPHFASKKGERTVEVDLKRPPSFQSIA